MPIAEKTKCKMKNIGRTLFIIGIILILAGTFFQVYVFISSEGKAPTQSPFSMVWGGIVAALGIVMTVGGRIMLMAGSWENENEDPDQQANPE